MKYPIGIQNFEKVRTGGYAYVDKTDMVYRLVSSGAYYFLSRPRRFGKSLLLSTIRAYYEGKRELFEGLAIAELETAWEAHPVLYLDLNTGHFEEPAMLASVLDAHLKDWEAEYGGDPSEPLALRFRNVIKAAHKKTGQKVVILVDEYDKPLLDAIDDQPLQDCYCGELKAFYSNLKSQDEHIEFGMLTGVTRQLSIFSEVNHMDHISMDPRYTSICGITEQELRDTFDSAVETLATANGMNKEECYDELRRRYDGYHFRQGAIGIYNPYSVLNTLDRQAFEDYWFATATPTFLIRLLQSTEFLLPQLTTTPVSALTLSSIDTMHRYPVPVLYQSGYLTLKSYDKETREYTLDFPNEEVREGFLKALLPAYFVSGETFCPDYVNRLRRHLQLGEAEPLMQCLQDFFEGGDYRVAGNMELYYQNVIYTLFRLLGLYVEVEMATARGRIDIVAQSRAAIFVMELKLDKTADEALQQIDEKGYALKFAPDHRPLYKIGVSFSSQTRGVADWKIA